MFKFVLCLAILAVSLSHVSAKISTESEQAMLKHIGISLDRCAKELNQNAEEAKELYKSGKYESMDKCLISCCLKYDKLMNEEGKIDLVKGLEVVKGYIPNLDDYKTLEGYLTPCVSVNDEAVSDGAKGCERAALFSACYKNQLQQ